MADIRAENADLATIEAQAGNIWPIGYLVTALLGSGDVGEEQAYSIHDITYKHVPSLIAEVRAARAVIEAGRDRLEWDVDYQSALAAYDALRAKQGGK